MNENINPQNSKVKKTLTKKNKNQSKSQTQSQPSSLTSSKNKSPKNDVLASNSLSKNNQSENNLSVKPIKKYQLKIFNLQNLFYAFWLIPALIILGVCVWVFCARTAYVFDFTLDDSFITYRYGKHLAEGVGLFWNVGESPPVEGYTTFLWVIISAIFELLKLNTELFSKYLSILSIILILPLISLTPFAISKSLSNTFADANINNLSRLKIILIGSFLSGLFLVASDLPAHAVSGMETMFATLLLLLMAINLAYYDLLTGKIRIVFPAMLGLLCGLIRPEFNAGVFGGLISLFLIRRFWLRDKVIAKEILISLAIYFVCGLIFYLWRFYYFGLAFPLPFYIKQLEPTQILFKGLVSMQRFQEEHWPFMVIAIVGVICAPKRLIAPAVLAGVIYGYFYFPEHVMGIYSRFIIPLLPIILWLCASAIQKALSVKLIPSVIWVLGMLILTFGFINGENPKEWGAKPQSFYDLPTFNGRWRQNAGWLNDYNESEHRSLIPLGRAIGEDLKQNPKRLKLAMVDLGAVAYYGDFTMIDLFGLTHPKLALARSRGNYNADMLLQESPDIVLLGEFFRENKYRGQFAFENDLYNRMSSYQYFPLARFKWNRVFGFLVYAKSTDAAERFVNILHSSKEIQESLVDLR